MKSTIFSIAFLALLLIFTSGLGRTEAHIAKGQMAPEIVLESPNDTLALSSLRGENVLLTFWSSADAASRVECNKYQAWIDANQPSHLRHVAINFDEHPVLFEEIVRRDNFDAATQHHVHGREASRIIEAYHLDEGFGSILIGPDGRIREINPPTYELSSLM
ncbi:MAG: hypothetical protein LUD17_16420 [Bacteroidales bacterium]|nr:hypothetical protein [Bacteroidales bacterium]MCD8388254.1 hypothetical protein [Bacteroidales bacterium]MCD8388444.1 hypothetical protein [Bacteroidales bacterium]